MGINNIDERETQYLEKFRKVISSYEKYFQIYKNHVSHLLENQNYSSGIFRERILKNFLAEMLPKSVSVDSGFIYGFEQIPNSKQLDIIIWDSSKHAAIYKTNDFVIVPPESVISVITVKSSLTKRDIKNGLENLISVSKIETTFRENYDERNDSPLYLPISKFLISYSGPVNKENALKTISDFYINLFQTDKLFASKITSAMINIEPTKPKEIHMSVRKRIFPILISSIESRKTSYFIGFGPPDDLFGEKKIVAQGLRRLPYVYRQNCITTSPFEKVIFFLLSSVYKYLNTPGWTFLLALANLDPITGLGNSDTVEVIESEGLPLINPDKISD